MEIHLVRHTRPDVAKGICYGQSDVGLASSFGNELASLRANLPSFDTVYSSPLRRCQVLAESLVDDPIIDLRIMEMNFGEWEMKKWDEIPDNQLVPWMNDFVNVAPPNGESLLEMSKRVQSFWNEIVGLKNEKVLVLTHAGVIRILKSIHQNIPLDQSFNDKAPQFGGSVFIQV